MSLRWYAFLCGFGSDVLFTINHLRSISFFCQNAHHNWLTKEYISNWFLVFCENPILRPASSVIKFGSIHQIIKFGNIYQVVKFDYICQQEEAGLPVWRRVAKQLETVTSKCHQNFGFDSKNSTIMFLYWSETICFLQVGLKNTQKHTLKCITFHEFTCLTFS